MKRRKTQEQFVEELHEINDDITVEGQYTLSTERIQVRCNKCGHRWSPKAYSLLQGKGCPKCSARKGAITNKGKTGLKSKSVFVKEMSELDPNIEIIGEYVNTHTDIECRCKICGNVWNAKPYSLLQKHGCPRCAKSGTSFMEQFIRYSLEFYLGEENVISRDKEAIGMELDIYLPSLNFAIEPGSWNLHRKWLKRDKLKREKCAEKSIQLITIYDKYTLDDLPFEDNCFAFKEDLNKADHQIIKQLVLDLVMKLDIYNGKEPDWDDIEKKAYESAKAKTHTDFVKELNTVLPTVTVLGTYVNSNKKIRVRCNKCGFEWDGVPANMLRGDGCRKCGTIEAHKSILIDQKEFVKRVKIINPDVEIIGDYKGRHNTVQTRCRLCGYIWNPVASSLLRGSTHKGAKSMHQNRSLQDEKSE